jgi:HAE1 family hydrophobic/amphiphilic exporter-1/multidrug efflux pump
MEAARVRFRPFLMTSIDFILGVLPLAISTGAGAGARHSAGTGVMGGMVAATFLAIFFVPLFFRVLTDRKLIERRSTEELKAEISHVRDLAHKKTDLPHVHPH